jgi:hypothetical protein
MQTSSERRMKEELEEKDKELNKKLNAKFKANPIPESTSTPK